MSPTEIEQLLNLPHPTAKRLLAPQNRDELLRFLTGGAVLRSDFIGTGVWSALVWLDGRCTQSTKLFGIEQEGLLEEIHNTGSGTRLYRLKPPQVLVEDVELGATLAEVVLEATPVDLLVNTAVEVLPMLFEAGAEAVSQLGGALADIGSGLVELSDTFDFTLD